MQIRKADSRLGLYVKNNGIMHPNFSIATILCFIENYYTLLLYVYYLS